MNKYAKLTRDLQLLESGLIDVLRSPVYADMVRTGLYNPDLSLLDALHALQQCISTTTQVLDRSPWSKLLRGEAIILTEGAKKSSLQTNSLCKNMAHPLGYYTAYTPGDTGLLAEMQETYGAQLQKMNKSEKLHLASLIAGDLSCLASLETPYRLEIGSDITELFTVIRDVLTTSDKEGLLECLVNGARYPS